jgi:HEAT repeat protein
VVVIVVALAAAAGAAAEPSASVNRLRALLLDGASDRARLRAADMLGDLDDQRAETVLVEALSDSREIVRMGAARALGRPGRVTALDPLLKTLGTPAESTPVRAAAAASLGTIGDARAAPALVAARRDPASEVRTAARQALLALPVGTAPLSRVELLSEILADREGAERPRADAARRLGETADSRALPLLVAALQTPATASRPVGSFTDLVGARAAAKTSLPASAARALAGFPPADVVPVLVRAAPTSVGEGKIALLETLARLRARDALPVFVAALADREPRARRWAALALADLAEPDMRGALRSAVADADDGVRLYATRALVRLGDVGAVDALVEALERERVPLVRDALIDALALLAPVSPW